MTLFLSAAPLGGPRGTARLSSMAGKGSRTGLCREGFAALQSAGKGGGSGQSAVGDRQRRQRGRQPAPGGRVKTAKRFLGRGLNGSMLAPLPKFAHANFDLPSRG